MALPSSKADEVDKNKLKDTKDLFSSICGLEHLMNKMIVEESIWFRKQQKKGLKAYHAISAEKKRKELGISHNLFVGSKIQIVMALKKIILKVIINLNYKCFDEIDPKIY